MSSQSENGNNRKNFAKISPDEKRLGKYDLLNLRVKLRPENPGGSITDNLSKIQNIRIDPETLDTYSEVMPLEELIEVMRHKLWLGAKLEIPKWGKRGKIVEYGWGVAKSVLKMNIAQKFTQFSVAAKKENDLVLLKHRIKEYAQSCGYICGFTKIDRRFISNCSDSKFPYDTALVLGMEMDYDLLNEAPTPGRRLYDFEIYVKSGERVFDVARFIRSTGHRCWARVPFDGVVKYPPHAINAGLGELGANGVAITPQYGPRQRWTMISIDAEIEPDAPIDYGVADYCDACKLCIKACPARAIPEERIWWRGVLKRKINDTKCFPYFERYEGCAICLKICPFHRFGYEKCMEAFRKDGIILGKSAAVRG